MLTQMTYLGERKRESLFRICKRVFSEYIRERVSQEYVDSNEAFGREKGRESFQNM